MVAYALVETDAGLTIAELQGREGPEEAALRHNGVVVDPGPFASYEDAYDAVLTLQDEEEEAD